MVSLFLKGLEENLEALIRNTSDCWECLQCGKQAKTKQHIKYHAETHLGIKHICRHCGKYYKTTHSLSVHISQSHKLYTDWLNIKLNKCLNFERFGGGGSRRIDTKYIWWLGMCSVWKDFQDKTAHQISCGNSPGWSETWL